MCCLVKIFTRFVTVSYPRRFFVVIVNDGYIRGVRLIHSSAVLNGPVVREQDSKKLSVYYANLLGENLARYNFFNHKYFIDCSETETECALQEASHFIFVCPGA